MQINASTNDFNIVEEETNNLVINESFQPKHPNTGFPTVFNRNKSEKKGEEASLKIDEANKDLINGDCQANTSLVFNFTQNDILKLRWTNPLGEDVNDLDNPSKTDMNLHNLRFDFEGNLCDNSNPEEKSECDDMYFYKGLHHHSDQGEFEGYTIPELMHLSRSSNVSQRCIAIRTLGNIFIKIREYHTSDHQIAQVYHKYLLGYLFGIHRWYKYLTGDLSIHYLLLSMLFHESYTSRTAENSVIALNNLLSGGQFNTKLARNNFPDTNQFKLLSYFLTPSEFIFELLDEKSAYFSSYFRYSIISQRIEFFIQLRQKESQNIRYNDLREEDHLIRFDLPDGRSLELLRDTMQEIFNYVPTKYDSSELSTQKNYLFIFLCKMAQNKGGTLDSRISSFSLISLFIQRECIYDQNICLETFENMLNSVGDEVFDFSSSELVSQDYSNSATSKLLLSFLHLVNTYTQSLYNGNIDTNNTFINIQKNFLTNFLIKSVIPTIRIAILTAICPGKLNSSENNELIQLSLVEGVKIIGLMTLKNIYLEDLSIFCKDIIHYFTLVDLTQSMQLFITYHIFSLGCNLLIFSYNNEIEYEHLQYIQVLKQLLAKIHEKVKINRNTLSITSNKNLGFLLLSVSTLRFQVLLAERYNSKLEFENFELYFELLDFCENYLETYSKQDFDIDLLTLETGFLLEVEMGITNIQSILQNNQTYLEFYSIILISTFLKELSRIFPLLPGDREEKITSYLHSLKPSFNLLSNMYQNITKNYIIPNSSRTENSDLNSNTVKLFSYELSYFEALNMNDAEAVVTNNNIVKKNSIYLQILNSNLLHLNLLMATDKEYNKTKNSTEIDLPIHKPNKKIVSKFNKSISELESLIYDPKILYENLFMLLFNSKNLEEYSIALYWILRFENQVSESFDCFYDKVLENYSSYFNNMNLLMFNPFIYSVNIVYNQITDPEKALPLTYSPFLMTTMKKVLSKKLLSMTDSKLIKTLISFLSKYILEYSINQIIRISKSKNSEADSFNFKLINNIIFEYLKFSLELENYVHTRQENHFQVNEQFQDSLLEMICDWKQNKTLSNLSAYNLSDKSDNESLRKLIESLISAFCDSNIYFFGEILDCYYFLFVFCMVEAISDSDLVLKIISNIKIMKFLLFHNNCDILIILERIDSVNTKIGEISSNKIITNLIIETVALYKDSVSKSTLLVMLVLYFNYYLGSKSELIDEIKKLYNETKLEYLKYILDSLNKN